MLKNKLYRRLLIVGITGSILISSGVMAFAATTNSSAAPKSKVEGKFTRGFRGEGKGFKQGNPLSAVLKTQVTSGVITQAEADKITEYLKAKETAEKAKRDAAKAKFDAMTDAQKKADKDAKKVARDAQKAKLDAMTDAERKAYIEANKPAKANILKELVTAGLLTQDQATKIEATMSKRSEIGKERGKQAKGTFKKGFNSAGKISTVTE